QVTIIGISLCSHRNYEIKILIRGIWIHCPHVVVNTRSAQVRSGESIVHSTFCTDRTCTPRTLDEYPVLVKQAFKLFKCLWIFIQKFIQLGKRDIVEIALESTDTTNICSEAAATDL